MSTRFHRIASNKERIIVVAKTSTFPIKMWMFLAIITVFLGWISWAFLFCALYNLLMRERMVLGVSNRRIVRFKGIITDSYNELSSKRGESMIVQQGLIGKMFNYGHLIIVGKGGSRHLLGQYDNVTELRRCIEGDVEYDCSSYKPQNVIALSAVVFVLSLGINYMLYKSYQKNSSHTTTASIQSQGNNALVSSASAQGNSLSTYPQANPQQDSFQYGARQYSVNSSASSQQAFKPMFERSKSEIEILFTDWMKDREYSHNFKDGLKYWSNERNLIVVFTFNDDDSVKGIDILTKDVSNVGDNGINSAVNKNIKSLLYWARGSHPIPYRQNKSTYFPIEIYIGYDTQTQ